MKILGQRLLEGQEGKFIRLAWVEIESGRGLHICVYDLDDDPEQLDLEQQGIFVPEERLTAFGEAVQDSIRTIRRGG